MMKAYLLTDAEINGASEPAKPTSPYPTRWIRLPVKGHCPETGLSRAAMYQLIAEGKIKTACIRRPGTVRGQRLVYLPSVLEFLDREAEKEAKRIRNGLASGAD